MKARTISLILFICLSAHLSGQTLFIPSASTVTIDGTINNSEWSDADTVLINHSSTVKTKVLFKHDGISLNIAFVDNLQSAGFYFPEIMVDALFDKSSSIQPDDWWFHVSATDCEYQGQYGNYDSCMAVRPNWHASPNFQMSGPATNKVEISIPFTTIGINVGDTIGICFLLNDFQSFKYFPTSANHLNPSSWQSFIIESNTSSLSEADKAEDFMVFPNPSSENITLKGVNSNSNSQIEIFDMNGKLKFQENISQRKSLNVEVKNWKPGIYVISYQSDIRLIRKKIIVQ